MEPCDFTACKTKLLLSEYLKCFLQMTGSKTNLRTYTYIRSQTLLVRCVIMCSAYTFSNCLTLIDIACLGDVSVW